MTSEMSGKFDYSGLRSALKDNGVKTQFLNSAIRRVAKENGIDTPEQIDKSQQIKVSKSIFEIYADKPAEETLAPYTEIDGIIESDKPEKLPEIFNDDDYEVAEYDDYYNFQTPTIAATNPIEHKEPSKAKNDKNSSLNFEQFKDKYGSTFSDNSTGNTDNQDEFLKQIFNLADVNSNQLLDKSELSGAFYAAQMLKGQGNNFEFRPKEPTEEDLDPFNSDMIQTEMSGDSFNPQG